jgi:tetratricopeptide (TPR) repeat protein
MGPSAWIMLAAFLAVCALYCLTPIHNGNFFWHLRNGEDILDTGSIRTQDPFTWTFCGETWLQQEWVSEVLFAISWRTLDETGPVILKTLLIMAAVLLLAMAAMRRGAGIPAVVVSGLLWFALSHGRWIVRPHIVSILMFSLYLYLLARGTGGVLPSLAVFIPLQVIWTNAHAGFVMGWFLLGVPVLEGIVCGNRRKVLGRSAVLGGAVLSAGLHPNGFGSVTYLTDFLSRPLFRETIREWWSPFHPLYQPGHRISTTAVLLVALLAVTWIIVARRRKSIGTSRILALGALSAASLLSSRNIDFLALAAVAWVSPLLGRVRPVIPAMMLSAAAALPFVIGVPREFGPPREPGLGVDWSIYPRELASFLEDNPELLSARIFNTNEISGYLEYRFGERLPLYMDGRCHLYTERFYAGYLLLAYARPEDASTVMGILDSGGIDLALFNWPEPGESSAYILSASPAWRPVYWDSITVVYGRGTFLDEAGLQSISFEVVDPLAPQTLLQELYYRMPDSWKDELVLAASPPMNYQPAMIPATALIQCTDSLHDSPGFLFDSDVMRTSLDSVLSGRDPGIEDPRLRVLQAWTLARAGRYDDAMLAAEHTGDLMLQSSLAVLMGKGMRNPSQGTSYPPLLMVPPAAWAGYIEGEASMGDSAVIGAAAMFVSGMRNGSLDSVRAILDADMDLSPWGYSVSGSIAVLCGMDSMAVALGETAVSMNRNPYTLLMLGNIESIIGNGDRALELFSESLRLSDGFLEARLQRAEQLWRAGAVEEALADYRLLKELNYLTPAAEFHLMWGEHFAASPSAARE